jgi:hypothetical protein
MINDASKAPNHSKKHRFSTILQELAKSVIFFLNE